MDAGVQSCADIQERTSQCRVPEVRHVQNRRRPVCGRERTREGRGDDVREAGKRAQAIDKPGLLFRI